ncbi:major facilitator superfamily domain-containing protein [Lasiosphaeria miniovina]|uniref:Major facilitator superfamily domain-containing protein n=1 Tax=Lasiosphaeria miniovina TaxID=1954250 RepID=A0AA40DYA7_9PEZI|nr:major facilitator superfamily domain-containing protein [Lasiosphaeria miniovina]KAK0718117.1 major facilitator superfamily domain-containing protein [Lasiosphaeria miniovina]
MSSPEQHTTATRQGGEHGKDSGNGSNSSQWHDAAPSTSSSAQTSVQMTPDTGSDGGSDDNVLVVLPSMARHGDGDGKGDTHRGRRRAANYHHELSSEVYELEDIESEKLPTERAEAAHDDESVGTDGAHDFPPASNSGSGRQRHHHERRRRRGASISTTASFQLYTPDEEKAVVRKFDTRLVVFVALLYMLGFVDRSNIGNARIAGMDDDLQPVLRRDGLYEWALAAFYIAYIAFEWMSLLWKVIPAHIYVSMLVLSWGIVASLQAVAVNYPMLIFLRTLLGIGEAGFTGVPFYLSFFFKRHELAFRTAIFISAAPLATTFASSLAWMLLKVGEASPIAPWRLLFLVEGFPSVLVALVAWHVIPDSPETAHYLTAREKKVARLRLRHENGSDSSSAGWRGRALSLGRKHETPGGGGGDDDSDAKGLNTHDVLAVLCDPAAWLTAAILFLANMAYSSLPVFLPTILRSMGHDPQSAQALAAPPYFAAFLFVLATAHASDTTRARAPWLAAHALASAAGYGVLALADSRFLALDPGSIVRYLAVYPAAVGFFNVVVLTIAWSINNQRTASRQGGGFALLQLVGQCGPLVGTRLYPDADAPYYTRGMAACALAMLAVAALAGALRWVLARRNRLLDEAESAEPDEDADGEGEGFLDSERGVGGAARDALRERFRYML